MAGEQTSEVVLIEFQTELGQLESAMDILERTGQVDKKAAEAFKKTNAELQKKTQATNAAAKATQDAAKKEIVSIEQMRAEMEKFVTEFIAGFSEGIVEELKNAGFEFDEFGGIVKNTTNDAISLKAELADVTKQLQQLKLQGKDNTQQYADLTARAGELKDAIGDVATEINLAAANSQKLNGLIEIASGVAAGFALAQGTAALFGDESEALQETLLKVNAAMAVLQGLQQIQALLQKESAAATLLLSAQQKIYNAQLVLENALQSQSIVVRTGAAAAQRVLNFVMAANPIGLVATALAGLITLLATYGASAAEARRQTTALNVQLGASADAFKERETAIQTNTDNVINNLEREGAVRSQVIQQEIEGNKLLTQARRERLAELLRIQQENPEADLEKRKQITDEIRRLQNLETDDKISNLHREADLARQLRAEQLQGSANAIEAQLARARKNSANELALAKQLARARAAVELDEAGQNAEKVKLIQANLNKELRNLDAEFARVRQQDRIAGLEAALAVAARKSREINARTSQEEINLQKRIIQENARLELMQEGLTENQKLRIQKQSLSQQAELQRDFNQQVSRETLEDFISRNNAVLAELNLSDTERLRLTEENIIAQAEIEIQASAGIRDKILEIERQRDATIREIRLQTIQATLQYELDSEAARTGTLRRAQERVLSIEAATLQQRLAAINQLAALDIGALNRRQDALEEAHNRGLVSEKDYLLQFAQLQDEEARITEETEQRKTAARKAATEKAIALAVQVASQVLDIVKQAGDQQLEQQQQQIDAQRQLVDDLLETGAITEKDAEVRRKRLDIEEKKLRRQQAQREKDFATFKALLAIPQAYLTGLAQGGPILGAIYAALAAAQAIIIASRPVPKFGKGKKDGYQGPGEIGETGPELWQTSNGMVYVPKRAFVWLGKKDKVFNPQETRRMLEKPSMQVAATYQTFSNGYAQNIAIDYARLGKEVGRNIPQTGFNFDKNGFTTWVQGETSFTTYVNQRRSY